MIKMMVVTKDIPVIIKMCDYKSFLVILYRSYYILYRFGLDGIGA